jgi:predicted Zn-dependent protease
VVATCLFGGLGDLACPPRTASAQIVQWRPAAGGDAKNADTFNPAKFMQQLFGQETKEQKRKLASIEVSWKEEKRFGDQVLELFLAELRRQEIRVVSRGQEVRYLQSLVAELRPHLRRADRYRDFKLLLAETSATDARCLPGGTLVIFRGMLDAAQSEAAVVGVLGHEMSHIDHGHQLRHLKSLKLAQQTFQSSRMPDFQQMMNNTLFLTQAFARPFRPEHEREADQDAVTWTYRLGYDPMEFADLFLRWTRRDDRREPGAWKKQLPEFLRSHPPHRDRYDAVVRRVRELRRAEPKDRLYVGRENLERWIPRSKQVYEE